MILAIVLQTMMTAMMIDDDGDSSVENDDSYDDDGDSSVENDDELRR